MKAICLFSGGLDSLLAAKILIEQDIRVLALHFSSVFIADDPADGAAALSETAARMGMEFRSEEISEEMIAIVRDPSHGHGSQMNPCIDCRILQLRKARELMPNCGAQFLATGEVVGQRPMTQQKHMMRHVEKEAGVEDIVLRPLSAHILPPTRPEIKGWIDRDGLFGFSGRQRKPQMELAEKLGIKEYPPPAGGCRLTEPGYARRIRDLLAHNQLSSKELPLLRIGRHFRLDAATRLVVGRVKDENEQIEALVSEDHTTLQCVHCAGPTSLLTGQCSENNLVKAARITARYGQGRDQPTVEVAVQSPEKGEFVVCVPPAGPTEFDHLLI